MISSAVQLKNRLKNEINTQIELVDSLKRDNQSLMVEVDSLMANSKDMSKSIDSLKRIKNKVIFSHSETVLTKVDTLTILELDNAIIEQYEDLVAVKDSVITKQHYVILNDKEIQNQLELAIQDKDLIIKDYNERLIKEKNKKIFFEITTATAVAGAVVLMFI